MKEKHPKKTFEENSKIHSFSFCRQNSIFFENPPCAYRDRYRPHMKLYRKGKKA